MSRILIITTEFIRFEGSPTGGRGVRTGNLADGLRKNGHTVFFSFPKDNYEKLKTKPPSSLTQYLHNYYYDEIIKEINPEIIIFSPWTLMLSLKNDAIINNYFIGADLPGPLVIENSFQNNEDDFIFASKKIVSLNKADFFLCSNERQKYYIMPWLLLSGHSLTENNIIITPISSDLNDKVPNCYPSVPEYIFGGVLWPWQNYGENLKNIAEFLAKNRGILKTFCGSFIYEKKNEKLSCLDKYETVKQFELINHEDLITQYKSSSAAIELYCMNNERILANTTRTLEYFANGLPVIYSKNMFFSDIIQEYNAGWVIDPENQDDLFEVLKEINSNPMICAEKGENAKKIIKEKFHNRESTKYLSDYCNSPFKTKKTNNYFSLTSSAMLNQSEAIAGFLNSIADMKIELNEKQEIILKTEKVILEKSYRMNEANEKINFLENENRFLTDDLNRIKSRIIFKILLKLKKIFY